MTKGRSDGRDSGSYSRGDARGGARGTGASDLACVMHAGGTWRYGSSPTRLSHPVFRSKLNAFLYVCQDQVSHIKRQIVE
jgi:hypothetical protein